MGANGRNKLSSHNVAKKQAQGRTYIPALCLPMGSEIAFNYERTPIYLPHLPRDLISRSIAEEDVLGSQVKITVAIAIRRYEQIQTFTGTASGRERLGKRYGGLINVPSNQRSTNVGHYTVGSPRFTITTFYR